MSESRYLATQQPCLPQISSELDSLEQIIEHGSLNEIWAETDRICLLFNSFASIDQQTQCLQQRFEKMIRETQEQEHRMHEIEQTALVALRNLDEEEEYRRQFEAELDAILKAERLEEKTRQVDTLLYEAEETCACAEIDHALNLLNIQNIIYQAEKICILAELDYIQRLLDNDENEEE